MNHKTLKTDRGTVHYWINKHTDKNANVDNASDVNYEINSFIKLHFDRWSITCSI